MGIEKAVEKTGTGWKTTVSGVVAVLLGVGGFALHIFAPGTEPAKLVSIEIAMGLIVMGMGILGIGHKIERIAKVAEKQSESSK